MSPITPQLLSKLQVEIIAFRLGLLSDLADQSNESAFIIALIDYVTMAGAQPSEVTPRLFLAVSDCLKLAIACHSYAYPTAPIDDMFLPGGEDVPS